ncbi:MAG: transcriptional regulator [Candidatus Odinarchaeota archaeon]
MSNDPMNIIKKVIENSKSLNAKVFNLTRYLLLTLMDFNRDGIQFRELKALLDISDGKLKSNLDYLEEVNYIKKVEVKLDGRKMHIYMITDLGKIELVKIIKIVEIVKNFEGIPND